jgi:hypothetical protein
MESTSQAAFNVFVGSGGQAPDIPNLSGQVKPVGSQVILKGGSSDVYKMHFNEQLVSSDFF